MAGISEPILLDFPEEIVGERIVLRPLRDEDAEEMFAAIRQSREHLLQFLPWPDQHQSVDDTLAFIRRTRADVVARRNFGLGNFSRADGHFLGGIGLHAHSWEVPSFEIGYWIRQDAEGKGYVTEGTALLTRLAFETFGANRILIRCDTRNARSQAIPERLGYVREGVIRNEVPGPDGRPRDMIFYGMIPADYEARRW